MLLDDTRRCPGGRSRIAPVRVRADCVDCTRRRPWGEDPGPDDIDPIGCWVDATAHRPGYCTERRSQGFVLTSDQVAAMDETAGLHGCTVPKDGEAGQATERGGEVSAMHSDGGDQA